MCHFFSPAQYLARCFDRLAPEQAINELQRIALTKERFDYYLARLPATGTVEDIRQITGHIAQPCNVRIGRYEIFDETAGLFRKTDKQESPQFVTDVRCHIDSVFYNPRNARKIYRGHLRYAGKRVNFDLPVTEFEKDAIGAVTTILVKRGLPEPTFLCTNRFFKNAVFAMSPMKGVHPVKQIGWHAKTQSMDFPQFRIMKCKGIVPTVERAKLLLKDFPARNLEPPVSQMPHRRLTRENITMLMETAVPFCITCSLVAQLHRLQGNLTIFPVSGGSAKELSWIAESLGIPVVSLRTADDLQMIRKHNSTHRWPLLVLCLADPLRPLIEQLKPGECGYCLFHVVDADKASRLFPDTTAVTTAVTRVTTFFDTPKHRKPWWQGRLPILKHIFFDRLRHHVQNGVTFDSALQYLRSEKEHWLRKLNEIAGISGMETDNEEENGDD